MNLKKIAVFIVAVLILLALAGCQEAPMPTTDPVPSTTTAPAPVEQLKMVVTEENISQLAEYPDLKELDLSGSTCYAAIAEYITANPQVKVTYTVELGAVTVEHTATELVIEPNTCENAVLLENLAYLPLVETVDLGKTDYAPEEIAALRSAYPEIVWHYTMIYQGQELTNETVQVDFSALEPAQLEDAALRLSLFPNITQVELMNAHGQSKLTVEQVKILVDGAPNARFHYVFKLFGKTVSTTDERIEFEKEDIGNEGEAEIRAALDILQGCTYFKLDDCGLDNEVLAKIRDDYPNTEVVWRIHVWSRSWLTDTDTIRAVYHVDDNNCEPFKYCTKTKYIDMGHNETLTDISFISYMPDLEIVILSGSPISDLTPFENAKKLIFLELAWCGHLEDISPLAGCTALENLNLSYAKKVKDLSALNELPLKQLMFVGSRVSSSVQKEQKENHPDCWVTFSGNACYGKGWRYKQSGAYTEIYQRVRDVFQLDEVDKLIAAGAK